MKDSVNNPDIKRLSLAGMLITFGVVYAVLGTSPLYTMKAILPGGQKENNELLIYGSLSCVFWTLTLQTTIKYIIITLRADNNGEGGIFALFALLRRKTTWAAVLTIIGAAALLANGVIAPSITVTSAIEGLKFIYSDIPVVPIVLGIFLILFFIQQFGTRLVGVASGLLMLLWFSMIAILGISQLIHHPEILAAVNPVYAAKFLSQYPGSFILLGAVFLCATGAEVLYSDLGYSGKENIRVSWIFVKTALLLNYFGQGAWVMRHLADRPDVNPFFGIMPEWFILTGTVIAILAAIIASQALISGSFTLISDAVSLNFWPKTRILHPSYVRGQVYLPLVNWTLFTLSTIVVLSFRESSNMEAAYGLAITITMIMTTMLLSYFLFQGGTKRRIVFLILIVFLTTECSFLIANLHKFRYGGWFTLMLISLCFLIMAGWYFGRKIKNRYVTFSNLNEFAGLIKDLHDDKTIPKTCTNLVYIIKANNAEQVESKVLYSIFQKQPKRAETYWLLHINRVDDPYRFEYQYKPIMPGILNRVDFNIGFRVEPKINLYFREVLEDLVKTGEITLLSSFDSLKKHNLPGDFKFILIDRVMMRDYKLSAWENSILTLHGLVRIIGIPEEKALQLDSTNTIVEQVPITIDHEPENRIKRLGNKTF
jgi:KUP system potassium uptake protein